MIFLKWLHRRQDEELLKTAEQVLKDFWNEISSMEVCGEEREVLENMIFLLLNTYMEEDEKKFLCDTDGKGCLDTLAAPLVLGENGGTYAASYDRCLEEEQGKYKTFAGILEKISPLSDLMYLQEWYFCTQERQEIERKGHSACWTLPTGCWGIGSLSIILFCSVSLWQRMDGRLYLPRRG